MILNRVVWIVVAVLFVAVAFMGGIVLGSRSAQRAAFLGTNVARGTVPPIPNGVAPTVPNPHNAPNGYGQMGPGMMGRGNGFNAVPNRRGFAPGFNRAPNPGNNGNGVAPRRQMTPRGNQVSPNPRNILPTGTDCGFLFTHFVMLSEAKHLATHN